MSYGLTKENLQEQAIFAVQTIKDSSLLTFRQFWPLFLAWLVSLAGPVALLMGGVLFGGLIDHALGSHGPGLATLAGIVIPGIMIGGLWGGWIMVTLRVARRETVHKADMLRPVNQILASLVVLVITTVCVFSLLPLFFIGSILFLKWQLAPYYIVDRNLGPLQALAQSWRDTNSIWMPLAFLDLAFFAVHALTGFTVVGPILSNIALGVASAVVYDQWLTKEAKVEVLDG